MEEKKKRFRPTLGQYRAQEKKIQELEERLRISEDNYNRLTKDYHKLVWQNNDLLTAIASKDNEISELMKVCNKRGGFWKRLFGKV